MHRIIRLISSVFPAPGIQLYHRTLPFEQISVGRYLRKQS